MKILKGNRKWLITTSSYSAVIGGGSEAAIAIFSLSF